MKRRSLLGLLGGTYSISLAGCTEVLGDHEPELVQIENTEIIQHDTRSVDGLPDDICSVSFDPNTSIITAAGLIGTESQCVSLHVDAQNTAGYADRPDDEVIIDIDPLPDTESVECEDEISEIPYKATVTVDSPPSAIEVYHIRHDKRNGYILREEFDD